MAKPASPIHGATFELGAIADELRQEPTYASEGQAARTLVREPDLRIVLVALKNGRRMAEHHAEVTATVHTLSGQVRLRLPERAVELPAGQLLVLGRGLRHDVEAQADSLLLLTLGWTTDA